MRLKKAIAMERPDVIERGVREGSQSSSGSGVTGMWRAELMRGKSSKAAATAVSSMISWVLKCRLTAAKAASSMAWPEAWSRSA